MKPFTIKKDPKMWSFSGKPRKGDFAFLDERVLSFPCDSALREARKWKVAFWVTFIGMLLLAALELWH